MKVLIVGAGPTGLTAGMELARRGIDATIIDKRVGGSTLSRAVGIVPFSLKLLEPTGVASRLIAEGQQMQNVKFYAGDELAATLPLQVKHPKFGYDFILMLPQDQTEAALRDAFTELGGSVRYSTEFAGLSQEGDKVTVALADGSTEAYDYVIGADGIKSSVRPALGLEYPGYELPARWSVADVNCTDWQNPKDFTICVLTEGKVAVVAPIAENRCRVISNTPDSVETLPLPMKVSHVNRAGEFEISVRQVAKYRMGRVFLAGDAAHCHSPVGGRGMNLGIADACELADCLQAGDLDRYEAERHKEGAATIKGSEGVRKMVSSTNPVTRTAFRTALRLVNNVGFIQGRMAEGFLYG